MDFYHVKAESSFTYLGGLRQKDFGFQTNSYQGKAALKYKLFSYQGQVDHPAFPDVHDADGGEELVLAVDVLHLVAQTLKHRRHPEAWKQNKKKFDSLNYLLKLFYKFW